MCRVMLAIALMMSLAPVDCAAQSDRFPRTQLLRQLVSPKPQDRRAGIRSVLDRADHPRATSVLLEALRSISSLPANADHAARMIRLLSQTPHSDESRVFLLQALEHRDPRIAIAAIDVLAIRHDRAFPSQLERLAGRATFAGHFGYRMAVLSAACRFPRDESGDWLVGQLRKLKGRDRDVVLTQLQRWAGRDLGPDNDAWTDWWAAGGKTLTSDGELEPPRAASGPTYFGMPITAKRIVFVIDKSGSMEEPLDAAFAPSTALTRAQGRIPDPNMLTRLRQAQEELIRAIGALPADTQFGLVVFDERIAVWRPRLSLASEANKTAAARFVATIQAEGDTAWYDALQTALNMDANLEAIYFLSDGVPTVGTIVSAPDIIRAISETNLTRRVSINSIGLGVDVSAERFLHALADRNEGAYRQSGVGQAAAARQWRPKPQAAAAFDPDQILKRPMPPIRKVRAVRGSAANRRLKGNELVLGVALGEQSRAYPLNMLTGPDREVINDHLGGRAIAATW